ncbi:hypothetical protein FA15DRAFT_261328 [Coprinopsis marcescibilis]|uniref:Uncharacterized protein n=1 Tax=Coprinopsis marcescibilis TaxID=230819 RepID=A0A5C3KE09_COPMA|nr:hypothetical protein FA15DRAFT_261328 [Coprinopsis marcescibilis]
MQAFLTHNTTSLPPPPPPPLSSPDSAIASVVHLLSRAHSLPCSKGALAFTQLVQPMARFQLALDALLPILDYSTSAELASRILVSFILYSLYAPHPIAVNPFKSALYVTYLNEREKAVIIAQDGGVSPNEQLVWVLWKILKGDGNDIGPYTPITLARSPLPPKLRAINLILDDEFCNTISDLDDSAYHYFQDRRRQSASSDTNDMNKIPTRVISPEYSIEQERQNERLIHAMKLLLAARDRVLNLSEQRALLPLLQDVASSRMVTSLDLAPIIAYNPAVAHPLLAGLVTSHNPDPMPFLEILPFLPPTLPTFDLLGRLLRDQAYIKVASYSTVAELVRVEVLGRFIHECVKWIEQAERDQSEGLISDDRFEKGLQHLCRFFMSLIKLRIVDPASDTDCAEICSFCLRYARFEEANMLYRFIMSNGSF